MSSRGAQWLFGTVVTSMLLGCAVMPRAHRSETTVRVMSYNIQAGAGNLENIAKVIREQSPDIVGLQEVDVHWSDRSQFADQATLLGKQLGMNVRFAPIYRIPSSTPGLPIREYGVAILSRFPIIDFANDRLTRLSTQDTGAGPTRMPGLLDAKLDIDGTLVRVFVTHLDYRADPAIRARQVNEMLEYMSPIRNPTILIGDLNAPPGSPELQPLGKLGRDTWVPENGVGLTYPAAAPVKRIDYVWISLGFTIRWTRIPPALASDHRPVVTELALHHLVTE